jgi:3-oxoacyl-[acyl-carrier protein] reductase
MRLKGRVALITGGSGGMGSVTAEEFAREGARAVGVHYSSSKEAAEEVMGRVKALGAEARAFRADVARRSEVEAMVRAVVDAWGAIDILVCFAGHPFRREEWFSPFEELGEESLLAPLRTDLLGSVHCCQAVIPHMRERGWGRIVLVGSTPAIVGDTVGISYLMAKAGILALGRALALYLGPHGIHVNSIAPGSIKTPAMAGLTKEEESTLVEASALKRFGDPREVARKAVFLASDDVEFQTGTTLVVDGGYALR